MSEDSDRRCDPPREEGESHRSRNPRHPSLPPHSPQLRACWQEDCSEPSVVRADAAAQGELPSLGSTSAAGSAIETPNGRRIARRERLWSC